MKTERLPYSDSYVEINENNIICRFDYADIPTDRIELKLSNFKAENLEFIPFWLDNLICAICRDIPYSEEEFESLIRKEWTNMCAEDAIIGNQLSHYQFGDKNMASDMISYYGKRSDFGDLFQRRYDFTVPDLEVRFKN